MKRPALLPPPHRRFTDRFWSRVVRHETGCWIWTGAVSEHGYGRVTIARRQYKAHRIAFWLSTNVWPGEEQGNHSCDNPPCVRPDHIYLGDQVANMADCAKKGRAAVAARRRSPLSDETVVKIRVRLMAGEVQRAIAADLGIHQSTVSNIKRGFTWWAPGTSPHAKVSSIKR